jgi:hypothetical protein
MRDSAVTSRFIERLGGASLILGSLLLAAYAALFPILLPIARGTSDFAQVVLSPNWVRLAMVAFAGVLLMIIGFYAVYSKLGPKTGLVGAIGFIFVEAAFLFQACKVTWDLFLYPLMAAHPESAFLLRDAVIVRDPAVAVFRVVAASSIFIGIVLFCLTLYRSQEFPKLAAILVSLGAFVYAIGPLVSAFVSVTGIVTLSIGCFLIGLRLLRVQPWREA